MYLCLGVGKSDDGGLDSGSAFGLATFSVCLTGVVLLVLISLMYKKALLQEERNKIILTVLSDRSDVEQNSQHRASSSSLKKMTKNDDLSK